MGNDNGNSSLSNNQLSVAQIERIVAAAAPFLSEAKQQEYLGKVVYSAQQNVEGEGEQKEPNEVESLKNYLFLAQQDIITKIIEHLKNGKDPNILLYIATGFGKSFIQIAFAGILENADVDYRIAVPDALEGQLNKNIDDCCCESLKKKIKSKVVSHSDVLKPGWDEKIPKSTFMVIDEASDLMRTELGKKRGEGFLNGHPCVVSSATPPEWLYEHIENTNGLVINISPQEKIEKMRVVPPLFTTHRDQSIMGRTNKRTKFLPYACVLIAVNTILLSLKVVTNTYTLLLYNKFFNCV